MIQSGKLVDCSTLLFINICQFQPYCVYFVKLHIGTKGSTAKKSVTSLNDFQSCTAVAPRTIFSLYTRIHSFVWVFFEPLPLAMKAKIVWIFSWYRVLISCQKVLWSSASTNFRQGPQYFHEVRCKSAPFNLFIHKFILKGQTTRS